MATVALSGDGEEGLAIPRRYWSVCVIAVATAMAVLDSAIANIALPTLTGEFHASPSAAVWIVNAYQLVIVVTLCHLPHWGRRSATVSSS